MTDSSSGGGGGGGEGESSWWGGWLDSAKQKSAAAYELVKKDLAEFSATVQHDTSKVTASLKQKLSQESTLTAGDKVKSGVSSFLDGITKALSVEPEDTRPRTSSTSCGAGPVIFDRAQARLHALQIDPSTYTTPPPNAAEHFNEWVTNFNLEAHKGDISELLVSQVEMRALYTHLVPSTVSHCVFWQRYFYRIEQLKKEEVMRAALMERAQDTTDDDDIDWDDEEELSCTSSDTGSLAVDPSSAIPSATVVAEVNDTPKEAPASLAVDIALSDMSIAEKNVDAQANTATDTVPVIAVQMPAIDVETAADSTTASSTTITDDTTVDTSVAKDLSAAVATAKTLETEDAAALKMRTKGDLVVVGAGSSDSASLSIESLASTNKELTDEDWEDFDEDVTDEVLMRYEPASKATSAKTDDHTGDNSEEDDEWENWD